MRTEWPESSAWGFARLFDPIRIDEFVDKYRTRVPLHLDRGDASYFAELPSQDAVDGLITATIADQAPKHGRLIRVEIDGGVSERPFSMTMDGRVDIQDVYRSYADGYSVVLNLVEQRSPEVAMVCRALASDLGCWVGANYYLTPPGAQGFEAHYDSHDVIVAQLSGTKSWLVGRQPYPEVDEPGLARSDFSASSHRWSLMAGDVAYIPKGTPHQAVAESTSSLHVTFGLEPWPEDRGSPHDLRSTYLSRFMARTGHFRALDALGDLTPGTGVERAIGGPMYMRTLDAKPVLEFLGGAFEFPAQFAEALNFVAGSEMEFRICDIPCVPSDEIRLEFARELIRGGALTVSALKPQSVDLRPV